MTSSAASTRCNKRPRALFTRRPRRRAIPFFLALLLAAAHAHGAQDPACAAATTTTTTVTIEKVVDGDTVALAGGERVRMVGIDTPELRGAGSPAAGALEARDWLAAHLQPGTRALAAGDAEDRDHYGRLLRHLFLADGTNLQAALLEAGLATPLVILPSLGFVSCYGRAADLALREQRGLWGLPQYQPVSARDLPPGQRQYRVVRARVLRVHRSRGAAWLELDAPLSISIPAASRSLFDDAFLDALPGKSVLVRGMVQPRGRGLRLYLRHPVDLLQDPAPGNPVPPMESN